ncbi:MAG: iron chelate uptake ABC transporter family permease subunit [Proteobacteria bacterium]|uniref:Iron chelate uptake ABC transporter family permease subunit n=1 Tax=Candidatus Avisuccinivibrio stercorigallinarum TaxID=2840704 RepID=A0A9D9DAC0_9GAMM|nr:iron chelate uptake ABC transporter family permease subunit [Candidatus Avisuccinivibrio stercorigallinarum]
MTAVVGAVSYIGLIVPNLVAIFKGDNLRRTLPDTALAGACFVLLCDLIGRSLIYPYELPIELIIGIVGTVIFIALIFYRLNGGLTFKLRRKKSSGTPASGSGQSGSEEVIHA